MQNQAHTSSQDGYDPTYFDPLFAAEQRHFWFLGRNRILLRQLRKAFPRLPQEFQAVEIGCGTGNVLRVLEPFCGAAHLTGMDLFSEGLQFARRRVHCGLVQADLHHPPFARLFDLVGIFDVLEHIPEDEAVLASLRAMLSPRGIVLITVPAYPGLWSYFDEASHHVRRYTRPELVQKLERAGLKVRFCSYSMATIFPMVWLNRKVAAGGAVTDEQDVHDRAVDELRIVPGINAILAGLLSIEAWWLGNFWRLPFGTSLLAVAERS
ncbi:MAG: class I SAM-dependent methyltransferase [Chloroflexi bacterium]|nr:class I SAM-dependent methyltransferase [Anaerolineaceae bacterium]NMB89202.1 class I SAM-dependent methyltransferase [Chloroflexota bacterium]